MYLNLHESCRWCVDFCLNLSYTAEDRGIFQINFSFTLHNQRSWVLCKGKEGRIWEEGEGENEARYSYIEITSVPLTSFGVDCGT